MKKHTRNQFTYNQQANNALRSFYSTQYRHEQLPTYRLISNNGYQRPVDAKHVAEIIDNFNPLYLDEIIVSHRDGQYFVVDGQNRIAALKKMNGDRDCMANCKVYTNLSYEDEAAMFNHLDAIKNKLKYHEKVKAMAEAGDNASVQDIKQILSGIGLRWSLTGSRSGSRNNISASRTLIECYETYGRVIFYHGMLLLKKTWDGDSKTLTAPFIKGICHFTFCYIQMVTEENFVKKLSCVSPGEIRIHAQQETTVTRQETKYARAFLKLYNQNRQMGNRLPDLLDETGIDIRKRNEMAVPFQTAMMPGPAKTASPRPRKNQQNRLEDHCYG